MSSEEQRDRLSKAMGAAFLQHTVKQLEKSVDSIQFSREKRSIPSNPSRKGGPSPGVTRIRLRERRIVDVSALVHALPLVKRWIREDSYQLIIPLEAISTLDILKRAPAPLNELAREATRFLETQLNIARQILATTDATDPKIRLRAQGMQEEVKWSELEQAFVIPPGFVVVAPSPSVLSTEEPADVIPLPSPSDLSLPLRSTLQCALHFQSIPSPPSSILLYSDPHTTLPTLAHLPTASHSITSSSSRHNPSPPIDFHALSTGNQLANAAQFFPSLVVTSITQVEILAAKNWMTAQAAQAKATKERETNHQKSPNGNATRERGGGGGGGRGPSPRKNGGVSERGGTGRDGGSTNGTRSSGVLFVP